MNNQQYKYIQSALATCLWLCDEHHDIASNNQELNLTSMVCLYKFQNHEISLGRDGRIIKVDRLDANDAGSASFIILPFDSRKSSVTTLLNYSAVSHGKNLNKTIRLASRTSLRATWSIPMQPGRRLLLLPASQNDENSWNYKMKLLRQSMIQR